MYRPDLPKGELRFGRRSLPRPLPSNAIGDVIASLVLIAAIAYGVERMFKPRSLRELLVCAASFVLYLLAGFLIHPDPAPEDPNPRVRRFGSRDITPTR